MLVSTKKHRCLPRGAVAAWAALLATVSLGCTDDGKKCVPVAGTVTIDGQPVANAVVTFYPNEGGRPSLADTDAEGKFRLTCFTENDGALLGIHRVAISAVDQSNPAKLRWLVPEKYGDRNESGLEVNVEAPTDSVELKLTWEGHAKKQVTQQGD